MNLSFDKSAFLFHLLLLCATLSFLIFASAMAFDIPDPGGGFIRYGNTSDEADDTDDSDNAPNGDETDTDYADNGTAPGQAGDSGDFSSDRPEDRGYDAPEILPGAAGEDGDSAGGLAEAAGIAAETTAVSFQFEAADLTDPDDPHLIMKTPDGRKANLRFGNAFRGIGVKGSILAYSSVEDLQCDLVFVDDGFGHRICIRMPWALYTPKDGWVKTVKDPTMTHENDPDDENGTEDSDNGDDDGGSGSAGDGPDGDDSGAAADSTGGDSLDPGFEPTAAGEVASGGFSMDIVKRWSIILGNSNVTSILALPDGAVWVGTAGQGLHLGTIRGNWRVFTAGNTFGALPSDHVTALAGHKVEGESKTTVFVGTNAGLVVYDGVTFNRHEATAGGLAGNTITALAVCPATGILYAGTQEGLSAFRGGSFHTMTTDDGLPSNLINSLCGVGEDIWAGTTKGAAVVRGYDPRSFGTSEGLQSQWVSCVASHPGLEGAIGPDVFIGTPAGVTTVKAGGGVTNYGKSTGMPVQWVKAMAVETDERHRRVMWCGTDDGLLEYDGAKWTRWIPGGIPLPSKRITTIVAEGGNLFVGTDRGLCVRTERVQRTTFGTGVEIQLRVEPWFDPKRKMIMPRYLEPRPKILDMEMVGSSMWIATDMGLVDLGSVILYDRGNSGLIDPVVNDICGDAGQNLWAATKSDGVVRFDGQNWVSFTPANSRVPSAEATAVAYDDSTGMVMAACGSNTCAVADKIVEFDGRRWEYLDKSRYLSPEARSKILDARVLSCDTVTGIVPCEEALWVCTDSQGLFRVDRGTGAWTQHKGARGGPLNDRIIHSTRDRYGNMWLATPDGLTMHHKGKWTHHDRFARPGYFGYPNLLSVAVIDAPGLEVFCAGRDLSGLLSGGGVMRFDGESWGTTLFQHVRRLMADPPFVWYGRDNGTVVKYKSTIMRPGKKRLSQSPFIKGGRRISEGKRTGGDGGESGGANPDGGGDGASGGGVNQQCAPSG